MILSDANAFDSDSRWDIETKEQMTQFKKWIKQDAAVLDFGIGIGRVSREILKEFPSVKVIGIDSSKKMLAYCKRYIPSQFQSRLQLLHFNKFSRIKDNSIDFAYALWVLQHVLPAHFELAVKELHRVVKRGGSFYFLNSARRCTFDNAHRTAFDDGIDQLKVISQYFREKEDIVYNSDCMKEILKDSCSKLFIKP